MYAIISDGGRQYRVSEGDEFDLDYREVPKGEKVTFEKVLAVGEGGDLKVGTPTVSGATVSAEVIGPKMGEKLVVQKIRRRKTFRRKTGHRQMYTRVRISEIKS